MNYNTQTKILFFLLILGFLFPMTTFSKSAGQNGAQFLRVPAGAKASALGGVYSALADDSFAIFWNPASLSNASMRNVTFSHALLPEDITSSWFAYVHPLEKAAIGLGVQYLSYGSIHGIDENNNDTGDFSPSDICVSVGYSRELRKNIDIGFAIKHVRSKITKTATSLAADAGINYKYSPKATFSFSIQNYGQDVKYISESDSLPLLMGLGASYLLPFHLTAVVQYYEPFDYKAYFAGGLEYSLKLDETAKLAFRTGWSGISNDISGENGLAFGIGLTHNPYIFEYSFVPMGDFGTTNKISFGASF